jgi:hypothetical protein
MPVQCLMKIAYYHLRQRSIAHASRCGSMQGRLALRRLVATRCWPSTEAQDRVRRLAGKKWIELEFVFTTRIGTPLDAAGERRDFRTVIRRAPGIDATYWRRRVRLVTINATPSGGSAVARVRHVLVEVEFAGRR